MWQFSPSTSKRVNQSALFLHNFISQQLHSDFLALSFFFYNNKITLVPRVSYIALSSIEDKIFNESKFTRSARNLIYLFDANKPPREYNEGESKERKKWNETDTILCISWKKIKHSTHVLIIIGNHLQKICMVVPRRNILFFVIIYAHLARMRLKVAVMLRKKIIIIRLKEWRVRKKGRRRGTHNKRFWYYLYAVYKSLCICELLLALFLPLWGKNAARTSAHNIYRKRQKEKEEITACYAAMAARGWQKICQDVIKTFELWFWCAMRSALKKREVGWHETERRFIRSQPSLPLWLEV